MKNAKVLIGVFVALASLWGGSYVLGHLDFGHWARFPSFFTTALGLVGGGIYAIKSASDEYFEWGGARERPDR